MSTRGCLRGTLCLLAAVASSSAFADGWYRGFTINQLVYSRGVNAVSVKYNTDGSGVTSPDNC